MENPNLEKELERLQAAFRQYCNPDYTPPPGIDLANAYTPPPDIGLANLIPHPAAVLIIGHRDAGKTALANRLQDLKRDIAPPCAVALPAKAARLLPSWYALADDPADVTPNAIIYIPESYRLYHARATQTSQGRAIGELVNLSRHRRHTLIFDVQNPAHLDRNIISEPDIVLVKEPGPFTLGFERPQLKPIMDAARAAFAGVGSTRRKRAVWVVAPASGIQDVDGESAPVLLDGLSFQDLWRCRA